MLINAFAAFVPGGVLEPFTYDAPALTGHHVLIKIHACGVCHSDIHVIDNDWGNPTYPVVPGHEAIGEVVELGPLVTHLSVGDRVGVGWQSEACLHCLDCLRGNENMCDFQKATILHQYGGFADYMTVDSRFAFPIPDGLDSKVAGPLLCGGITVYSGLRFAGMSSGQEIGVVGIGGLGHLAVQFAAKLGNRVTVFTTSPDKAEFAAQLGVHDAVILEPGGKFPAPTRKLNIIVDTVPHSLDWEGCLNHLDSDGVLTILGVPEKEVSMPIWSFQDKRRRIMGSSVGGRATMHEMLTLCADYDIKPLTETFTFDRANDALDKVRANTVRYRAVLAHE